MIQHFCDKCGAKLPDGKTRILLRAKMVEYSAELCAECYEEMIRMFPEWGKRIAEREAKLEQRKKEKG